MGEEKSKNPLDVFWEELGRKQKKYVRSYRSDKRHSQDEKASKRHHGKSHDSGSSRG